MRSFIECTIKTIIRDITSKRLRCVGHVARTGEMRNPDILIEKPKKNNTERDVILEGSTIKMMMIV